MKKILITLLIVAAGTTAFAQDSSRTGKKPMKHHRGHSMQQDLQLSEQQTAKVQDINKDFMTSAKAVQKDDKLTKDEKRTKLAEISKVRSEKYKSVLSADQYSKWESNRAATKTKMDGFKGKRDHKTAKGKHPEKMKQELGLNEEQSKQLKSIHGEFREKALAVRNNKDLSDTDRKTKFKELRKERDGKVKATLSAEQYEKLHKKHHPKGAPAQPEEASTNN
ncbi:hypothetical protein MKQ68_01260 [Chitinophaga horti]|uniref:LTXXQ motif family protein n=1 Tax=Chitinophaga horti TaxID=2920382 RepID=A0ABY6J6D1_9BACT|nr:hypothetical protein [Chitinophaga horti]UYQ93729.1 hypothetical protein MKQ68_01260 [Chitinophaga horti]